MLAGIFPCCWRLGTPQESAKPAALAAQLARLNENAAQLYAKTADYYAHFFDKRLVADTPDRRFNEAMRWAELAIDQLRVRHGDEVGLVAGFYSSGDSERPGFGWFFGRDALYTLYAINSYGDFALTRLTLEFLIRRQRDDGKIMHEFSQTASWWIGECFLIEYASADSTPLFLMAMEDYVKASGDIAFLRSIGIPLRRPRPFTRAHDSDGDGIYENTEGRDGWRSGPAGMPHQEIYLAALDQQACERYGAPVRACGRTGNWRDGASEGGEDGRVAIEREYDDKTEDSYAFSRNADGTLDRTASIYPAVAWWDGTRRSAMLKMFNAGPRGFFDRLGHARCQRAKPFYDPISYHQGSVWPLFTGWVSLAEYRAGRPLSAYAHLMQNAGLTWTQDLGAVTELLSGEFFQPLGRSSPHQFWSSAMVLTPALRGLFGITADALHNSISVDPHLPAEWDHAELRHVPVGGSMIDLSFKREGSVLVVRVEGGSVQLSGAHGGELRVPLPEWRLGFRTNYRCRGRARRS